METEKLIAALLIVAVIFSVITLVITFNSEIVVDVNMANAPSQTASVILDIVRNPVGPGGA